MLRLAAFRLDVTPPLGHPLCGGWITPAQEIVDRQWVNGVVLSGSAIGAPVALVAVDWCEIRNGGYDLWRELIAAALETTPERIAVQCVHPHDAPFADPDAERLLRAVNAPGTSLDLEYFEQSARATASAAAEALSRAEPVTEIGVGRAKVDRVASNRRILGPDGRVGPMRGSACPDETLRAAPEGLIDPWLTTLSFWNGDRLLAALHHYATHPMSHYGKGGVSCDFCGLARDRLAAETGAPQLYFTGAAGNLAAGKYNDGAPENREVLTGRMLDGMRGSLAATERQPVECAEWRVQPIHFPPRPEFPETLYQKLLDDPASTYLEKYRGASGLAFLRHAARRPTDLTCLAVNNVRLLHLPGEPFIEYQLAAQQLAPELEVMVAGYGDCSPGYLPTAAAFPQGGYEASWVALVAPEIETVLTEGITALLSPSR
jgi:hypothetical protein